MDRRREAAPFHEAKLLKVTASIGKSAPQDPPASTIDHARSLLTRSVVSGSPNRPNQEVRKSDFYR